MTSIEHLRRKIQELQGRLPNPPVPKPTPIYSPGYTVPPDAWPIEYSGPDVTTGPNLPDDWKDVIIDGIEILAIEQGVDRIIHCGLHVWGHKQVQGQAVVYLWVVDIAVLPGGLPSWVEVSVAQKHQARPSDKGILPNATLRYKVKSPTGSRSETITFAEFIAHLENHGLTKFRTNEAGYGCQKWTSAVVASLTQAGNISGGNYAQDCATYLRAVCKKLRDEGGDPNSPGEEGAFFGYEANLYMPMSRWNAEENYARQRTAYVEQTKLQKRIEDLQRDLKKAEKAAK